jgi:hypothetical protein
LAVNVNGFEAETDEIVTVNNNTFCFATIDKVFYPIIKMMK